MPFSDGVRHGAVMAASVPVIGVATTIVRTVTVTGIIAVIGVVVIAVTRVKQSSGREAGGQTTPAKAPMMMPTSVAPAPTSLNRSAGLGKKGQSYSRRCDQGRQFSHSFSPLGDVGWKDVLPSFRAKPSE